MLSAETVEALREAKEMLANDSGQKFKTAEEMFAALGI